MMFRLNTRTAYTFTRIVEDGAKRHREIKTLSICSFQNSITETEWIRIGTVDYGQLPKESFLASLKKAALRLITGEK